MSACRSCGAPITWIRTTTGRPMPVNGTEPEPLRGFFVRRFAVTGAARRAVVLPEDGAVVSFWLDPHAPTVRVWTSHFATCPQAREWRSPS